MSTMQETEMTPRVGDHVMVRGTRLVGDVTRVEARDGDDRVSVKVTAVLGKKAKSKTARAWRGAWVHCAPALVAPLEPSTN
jgi:hypothetical protein